MTAYKTIDTAAVKTKDLHGYLLGAVGPRPIAFASTISPDGVPNLAPFSFFNVFSANPPILIFSPARRVRDNTTKHTLQNILLRPEVVVNVVSYELVEQMNLASSEYEEGINEFAKAGLTEVASELVAPPRVAESPVQMECKVVEIKPLSDARGAGQLIFAKVLRMHIKEEILDAAGQIDPNKIDLVGRMGGAWYSRASGDGIFEVEKPAAPAGMGIDSLPEHIRNSSVLTGNDLGKLGHFASLPSAEAVADWWLSHGAAYAQVQDLHAEARRLLAAEQREAALMLLLKPS